MKTDSIQVAAVGLSLVLAAGVARGQSEPRRQPLTGAPIVVRQGDLPELSLREGQLEMELQEARREIERLKAMPAESMDPEVRKSRAERRLEAAMADRAELKGQIKDVQASLAEAEKAVRRAEAAQQEAEKLAARSAEAMRREQQRVEALAAEAEEYRGQSRLLARELRQMREKAESPDDAGPAADPEVVARLEAELESVRLELDQQKEMTAQYRDLAQASAAAGPKAEGPGPADDLISQGLASFRQGDLPAARASFEEALKSKEDVAAVHGYLGAVHFAEKRYRKARKSLGRCVELNPLDPAGHFNLAVLLASVEPPELTVARTHYEESLRLGGAPDPELEKRLTP